MEAEFYLFIIFCVQRSSNSEIICGRDKNWRTLCACQTRGVATVVYGYIHVYPHKKKSVQVDFSWGKNDVKTAIEYEY